MANKQLFTLREYAEITGRSYMSAFRDCRDGRIASIKLGGKRYIPAAALEALIASASTDGRAVV
jgi:hypothetical protein